ncbi:MAG: right-handed parallel beta-helix repeat-containing protein [Chitinophagaceae bacterium]|nr:right-handed parallel beta-helix repeat-containing protein [Chitinophagaceae bacterium]MCW5927208.1 right-handed parallel beta-helix repeat-containing protein [Chitinophagaceae bacterium]
MKRLLIFFIVTACNVISVSAQNLQNKNFNLSDYSPVGDGISDDTRAFQALFSAAKKTGGGNITIPPGNYYLRGETPVPLSSNTNVFAYGAKIFLPKNLGDQARIVLFEGTDVTNFSWFGALFQGYCFDPVREKNTWEPNANTRMIVIKTSKTGETDNLRFKDIQSDKIAGAVIHVNGYIEGNSIVPLNFATNVSVENCNLINSGKFMWDYGYLWQIIVFPEDHTKEEIKMANNYFDNNVLISEITIKRGDDKVYLNNIDSKNNSKMIEEGSEICFYNDKLPSNIIKGKRYYVVESTNKYIKVSEIENGKGISFNSDGGSDVKIVNNVRKLFYQYAPINSGPGKGCIDLVGCMNTQITGCRISALGDAMHIQKSHNNVFANNHILGARMGAFFIADHCKNSTVTGNTVDGTNGSRTVSIERSNENVTVIGNIFRNGGRGSWINQPKNIVIQNNVFVNNTTKGAHDPKTGRRDFKTGGWQSFPEIYFTTYQKGAEYGPVILKDNIFTTGPNAAGVIQFEKNGKDVTVSGNIFKGTTVDILMDDKDDTIFIDPAQKATLKKGAEFSRSLFKNE